MVSRKYARSNIIKNKTQCLQIVNISDLDGIFTIYDKIPGLRLPQWPGSPQSGYLSRNNNAWNNRVGKWCCRGVIFQAKWNRFGSRTFCYLGNLNFFNPCSRYNSKASNTLKPKKSPVIYCCTCIGVENSFYQLQSNLFVISKMQNRSSPGHPKRQ